MFCAGDEFMRTQQGNNNPYNQDNETSWVNWDFLSKNADIFRFFQKMIAFRRAHPSIGRSRFWREDVRWYGVGPQVDRSYNSHSLAFCLRGASQGDCDLYVMINAYNKSLPFVIQEGDAGGWRRIVDTALPHPEDFIDSQERVVLNSPNYVVEARSVVILTSE
jgi:glycogen operon protein